MNYVCCTVSVLQLGILVHVGVYMYMGWDGMGRDLGQVYISRNLLRNLMLGLGKRNFPKYPVPEGWVKDISRNITCQRA